MSPSGASSARALFPSSCAVADRVGPGPVSHVATTGSTNDDLGAPARRGDASGAVLVADHQTAGRGRLGRVWDDDPGGALLVSLRIPLGGRPAPSVVAAVGAAARAAAGALLDVPVLLKWPNDLVVVDGPAPGKLAGLLAEYVAGDVPVVIVGVGVNVAAIGRQPGATSIAECGGTGDRDRLLAGLLEGLAERLDRPDDVLDELRRWSATLGRRVRVDLPDASALVGTARELTDEGELVLTDDDGADVIVTAGDVVHLRNV